MIKHYDKSARLMVLKARAQELQIAFAKKHFPNGSFNIE